MRVDQLWRYPVRSVGGERLTAATVDALGIAGDRILDVYDDTGERTWAGAVPALMRLRAATVGTGVAELTGPDGGRFRSTDPDADSRLAAAVDAGVRLAPHRPSDPDAALHVLTTTSLDRLAATLPDSVVDPSRFRANLVLAGGPDGSARYPEPGWIGRRLVVGALRLRFTRGCDRCVMITKETPTAPHDPAVLRWIARELGNTFGVYAAVETPGVVRVGDEAHWLD